jgi:hypothetical protein
MKKIFENKYFLELYLKNVCYSEIKINTDQFNISGLDLIMSFNILNKSGFTGTPSIPDFEDINPRLKMQIKPEEPETKAETPTRYEWKHDDKIVISGGEFAVLKNFFDNLD